MFKPQQSIGCSAVLAMILTMGCASGGNDQNYRVLQEDRPILERETGEPRSAAPADDRTHFVAYTQEPVPPADEPPLIQQHGVTAPLAEADPSGVIDRSDWSEVIVGPAPGTVTHFPIYYEDRRLDVLYTNVLDEPTVERRLEAALQSGESTFTRTNLLGAVIEPLEFGIDTVLLPIRAVMTPPWERVTTPVREPVVTRGVVVLVPPGAVDPALDGAGTEVGVEPMEQMDEALE